MGLLSKIVRILDRLLIGILHKPCIAAEGIRYDHRLFVLLFLHGIHPLYQFSAKGRKSSLLFPEIMVKY